MLRVTVLRTAKGWSKAECARQSRLDQGLMTRIEQGRVKPYPKELARLAEALDFPAERAQALLDPMDIDQPAAAV